MGDFGVDTTVFPVDGEPGRYRAVLSEDWAIWGPNGGYVAAVLLRAAGAHTQFDRPASFMAHFLGTARFDEVQLDTATVRAGGRSESVRVSMTQDGKPIAEAMVWCVPADLAGLEIDHTLRPDVPGPLESPTIAELMPPDRDRPPFRFWENIEYRPLDWLDEAQWLAQRPLEPTYRAWMRLLPTAAFEDPWIEAARVLIPIDIVGWPAITRAFPVDQDGRWVAPNLDLAVTFHHSAVGCEHLLLDGEARIATGGLVGGSGRVWSSDGRLLATGIQQLLFREVRVPSTA